MTAAHQELLDSIRAMFDLARAEVCRQALHQTTAELPEKTCRYCGFYWAKWSGSKLDGHAKCIVTDEFKREIAAAIRDTLISYESIAERLDVSYAVVRSWVGHVWGRR